MVGKERTKGDLDQTPLRREPAGALENLKLPGPLLTCPGQSCFGGPWGTFLPSTLQEAEPAVSTASRQIPGAETAFLGETQPKT